MVKRHSLIFALVLAASSVIASDHPRLTKTQVIRLANAEARRQGYDLRKYGRPDAHFNYVTKDDEWVVFYEGKRLKGMPEVGNHFSVHIVDKTKEVWFIPGH